MKPLFHLAIAGLVCSSAHATAGGLAGTIVDAATGRPIEARIYVADQAGKAYFVRPSTADGIAIPYDKTNWIRSQSTEQHTTISAHPFVVDLPAGRYTVTVERGKEYLPYTSTFDVAGTYTNVHIPLMRWIDMRERGWFSGETHIHRTLEELPVVVLAEDLNVAMPITYWVTRAFTPPSSGDKNRAGEIPDKLIHVDDHHKIWPRNTEYEIFHVGQERHTLGALFILNQRTSLLPGAPPWGPIAQVARQEGALLDMDKLDWPFALVLPPVTGASLYELANNHLWRTEFAFTDWNSEAPAFLQPPHGGTTGNERDWLHYTLGMYYTLLNAGYRLVPCAGTASGVHPVPVGFSRVYVRLPEGQPFTYEAWLAGLAEGRSFVTTGPMLLVRVDDRDPGQNILLDRAGQSVRIQGEVRSEQRLAFLEVIVNGIPVQTIMPRNEQSVAGSYQSQFDRTVVIDTSGWLCLRCCEDRPNGRVRFAHTAPWWIEVPERPARISRAERDYLVDRVQDEIARSGSKIPAEGRAEYTEALQRYAQLPVRDDDRSAARPARDDNDLRRWLENMLHHHRYTPDEIESALDITSASLEDAIARWKLSSAPSAAESSHLKVLPYPGGRHPRRGFLDGAIRPQRDTKVSVFAPWDPHSYVVVDLPEAIFTNLGLTYLAHTHVRTIWEDQQVTLPPVEWQWHDDGSLTSERTLPNGIAFGAVVRSHGRQVDLRLWLTNGTGEPLTGMRAQVCVMLKGAVGFHAQTGTNKVIHEKCVAVKDDSGQRWIATAWQPLQRAWQNPPVPCLHSDPTLPDCAPGKTVFAHGVLAFYEGTDIKTEMGRLADQLDATYKQRLEIGNEQ